MRLDILSRAKLFIENFFAYGFIQILNKIIPFLLLPVITRLLPNSSDFGVFDMFNTIVGFGSPLIILGISDAMFREYFEKEDEQYKKNVTATALRIVAVSSIVVMSILIVFNKTFSNVFFSSILYGNIIIYAAVEMFIATNKTIIQAPTRMQNKRKIYIISGLISSAGGYLLSIALIYAGYSYLGLIYSNIVTTAILLGFFWILNHKFFIKGKFDKKIAKELFKIGLPLVPTFLIYWVYKSMDKIMIINMLGTAELGIYSIGSRVSQISQFIYMAFTGGWSYFVFSTMKDKDQVQLNSKVFEYLGAISLVSFIVIYPFFKAIFDLLFTGDYTMGYVVVPYLYMAPLLLMLFQVAGSQFLVIKKSYLSTICLSLGAAINVVLNFFLIYRIGVEGAAIATLISYIITITVVCIVTSRMKLLHISKRFKLISLISVVYLVVARVFMFGNFKYQLIMTTVGVLIFVILYSEEINMILEKLKGRRHEKRG
jgi:O-antigen/teichoic acid export membrane protein